MNEASTGLPVPRNQVTRPQPLLHAEDRDALEKAVRALEHSNLATRLARTVGKQLGSLTRLLPPGASMIAERAAQRAIRSALDVALRTLADAPKRDTRLLHKAAATHNSPLPSSRSLSGLTPSSVACELLSTPNPVLIDLSRYNALSFCLLVNPLQEPFSLQAFQSNPKHKFGIVLKT